MPDNVPDTDGSPNSDNDRLEMLFTEIQKVTLVEDPERPGIFKIGVDDGV